uniref:C-type lectin domain-containing protein n=1 Tax=Hippocampus comes TaxID=109280 RepID=A0A3Q2YER8_HIPCM
MFYFQFLPGSTDRNTADTQLLGTPVSAQYIRILPLEYSGQVGLRFEVLGCTPDCEQNSCFPLHLGWMHFNDKCFLFKGKKNDIKANWTYARSWCKDQGGELAVIDNQSENDMELPTWIGLSDILVENQYAWSDGVSPVLYTNWNGKEPNNAGGTEHCVSIPHSVLVSGKWNDDACHKKHSFLRPGLCRRGGPAGKS